MTSLASNSAYVRHPYNIPIPPGARVEIQNYSRRGALSPAEKTDLIKIVYENPNYCPQNAEKEYQRKLKAYGNKSEMSRLFLFLTKQRPKKALPYYELNDQNKITETEIRLKPLLQRRYIHKVIVLPANGTSEIRVRFQLTPLGAASASLIRDSDEFHKDYLCRIRA